MPSGLTSGRACGESGRPRRPSCLAAVDEETSSRFSKQLTLSSVRSSRRLCAYEPLARWSPFHRAYAPEAEMHDTKRVGRHAGRGRAHPGVKVKIVGYEPDRTGASWARHASGVPFEVDWMQQGGTKQCTATPSVALHAACTLTTLAWHSAAARHAREGLRNHCV